jgi:hypothetical protein
VLEGVPSHKHIVHDTLGVFDSILKIRNARGVRLTKRKGKRDELVPVANKKKTGGATKRKLALDDYGLGNKFIHSHAVLAMQTNLVDSKSRFDGPDDTDPVIKKPRVFEIVTVEDEG